MYQILFFKKINFVNYKSMTYYAKPNFIEYDDWFDENIDPLDHTQQSKRLPKVLKS